MASPPTASRKTRSRSASSRASTTRSASSSAAPTVYATRNICGSRCSHACSQRSEVAKTPTRLPEDPNNITPWTQTADWLGCLLYGCGGADAYSYGLVSNTTSVSPGSPVTLTWQAMYYQGGAT